MTDEARLIILQQPLDVIEFDLRAGRISQSLAQLFKNPARLYVYPGFNLQTQQIVTAKFWKKLRGSNLWEVRIEYAGSIYRVLAAFAKNNRVILLHAFQKKSQKTPRQDIEIALQRQKRYFQRHGYL